MLIYLDMCAVQRPRDDQSQPRIREETEAVLEILEACRSGSAQLASSDALIYETNLNADPVRRAHASSILESASVFLEATPEAKSDAAALVSRGLKPLDGLHLSLAVKGKVEYFCTCDDRLLKKGRAVQRPPPKTAAEDRDADGIVEGAWTMNAQAVTLDELNQRALDILTRELGTAETMRFVTQFSQGSGDYTAERQRLFENVTLDQIFDEIDRRRSRNAESVNA